MNKNYFDYSVSLMDTDVSFAEIRKVAAQDGRPLPLEENCVDDPETGKRWAMSGLWMAPSLGKDDLLAMLNQWGYTSGDSVQVEVSDNGTSGDGLWLSFFPCARAGTPENVPDKFGTNRSEKAPRALLSVRLTAEQAAILGQALLGAARLRNAQNEDKP